MYAFKPKAPLSFVDRGIDPGVGVAAWLEAHKQNEFKYRPAQDATAVQRFGELTGATVLQVLIPLMIVMLTFSAFSAEREQGTLRQLLSLGVKRSHLAAGKALGTAWALGMLLVPATVLGVIALSLTSENGALLASVSRLTLMILSYLAYFAAIIAVSLAVSAWARSSRLALVTLLGFWIFNSLIAPRVVADSREDGIPHTFFVRVQPTDGTGSPGQHGRSELAQRQREASEAGIVQEVRRVEDRGSAREFRRAVAPSR